MIWPFEFRLLQGPYASQQRNFEELCAFLIKSKHPDWKVIPRESPDWGVDFLAKSPKKIMAFQCKFFIDNFGKSQLRQINKSLKQAMKYQGQIGMSEYIVCLPRNLTAQGHEEVAKIGKLLGVKVSILQANDLWALLTEFPSVQYTFFPSGLSILTPPGIEAVSLILEQVGKKPKDSIAIAKRALTSLNSLNNRYKGLLFQVTGHLCSKSGDYGKALAYHLQAKQFFDSPLDRTEVLRSISEIYLKTGQNVLAHQSLIAAQKIAPREMKAPLKNDCAEYFLLQQDHSAARAEIKEGLSLAKKLKQRSEIARAYTLNGDLAFNIGDWTAAKRNYSQALKIWQSLGDSYNSATILSYLGSILHRQGRLSEALERLTESVKIFENARDLPALTEAMTSLGMILFEMGEWYSSQQYHRRCLQIENILGNIRGQSICFNNLGLLARVQGNHKEAINYHQNALRLSKHVRDIRGMTYAHGYLGLAFLELRKWDLCRKHFYAARKLARRISFRFEEALSNLNLSQLAIKCGKPTLAVKIAQKGFEEIKRVGGVIEIARAYRILGEAYLAKGDLQNALKYAKASTAKFRIVGAPYERALSLSVLSVVQNELKDFQAARQSKARADELMSKIGSKNRK